jgi:hypothetical protein
VADIIENESEWLLFRTPSTLNINDIPSPLNERDAGTDL